MGFFNLLEDVNIAVYGETYSVYLNWIGKIIRFLIEGVGSVGIGIILFSLVLKIIVLPFDVYQRVAMRKQNLKMKEQQARMEKLQKQYANDKNLYNQKVMEMYKENGISMFSSCLPMILSMVIFIVAINAFNSYSQYSNLQNYNTIVNTYDARIEMYCPELGAETTSVEKITVENEEGEAIELLRVEDSRPDKFIYFTVPYDATYAENDYAYIKNIKKENRLHTINVAKAEQFEEINAKAEELLAAAKEEDGLTKELALKNAIVFFADQDVQNAYDTEIKGRMGFLWIKNIWATDASYKHPIESNASNFFNEVQREKLNVGGSKISLGNMKKYTNAYTTEVYNEVTKSLSAEKNAPNGYFVLIVLSIGTILLQQIVSMRSQKEQQKYATVDGQGATQQKTMLIVMTGMFAIFSFMYSSAFSIYMITSNIISLLSTLIINKLVDTNMRKKEEAAEKAKNDRRFTHRINAAYEAGKQASKEEKKKKNSDTENK